MTNLAACLSVCLATEKNWGKNVFVWVPNGSCSGRLFFFISSRSRHGSLLALFKLIWLSSSYYYNCVFHLSAVKRSKDLSLLRKTAAAAAATVVEDTSRLDQTDHRLTTFSFFLFRE